MVFLLPGDIQDLDQVRSLLPSLAQGKLKCDVLVAPGHGIHASKDFAEATKPALVLCSVFPNLRPRPCRSHKAFGAVGSKVYVTGLQGQLQVMCDGESYELKVKRPDAESVTTQPTTPAGGNRR